MTLLALLLACSGGGSTVDSTFGDDTGLTECGRLRGATGVLMYTEDATVVHAPTEPPEPDRYTTGVAGPLGDGVTWLAVDAGRVLQSTDSGCNWDQVGALPGDGWWQLLTAGDRVYAIDRDSGQGARTDDAGRTWTPFDAGEVFVGLPTVSAADPAWLRGYQSRGVVTSFDGGDSWSVTGAGPESAVVAAAVHPGDPDRIVVGTVDGVKLSTTGGGSWSDVTEGLTEDAGAPGVRGSAVAVHPDDADVLFALSQDGSGVYTLHRSADAGASWSRMADSDQVHLGEQSPLWPLPGAPGRVVSAYGSSVDDYGLDLYVSEVGVGTRTIHIGSYYGMTGMAFGPDRWIASVHGVP